MAKGGGWRTVWTGENKDKSVTNINRSVNKMAECKCSSMGRGANGGGASGDNKMW